MEHQPSDLESQVKRIADSLERIEQCYLRQAAGYDEDRKKWDRSHIWIGLLNAVGMGLGIAAGFYFFSNK